MKMRPLIVMSVWLTAQVINVVACIFYVRHWLFFWCMWHCQEDYQLL